MISGLHLGSPARHKSGSDQLTSKPDNGPGGAHSELDFEILGHNGLPYKLSTNVFAEDNGNREQQFKLCKGGRTGRPAQTQVRRAKGRNVGSSAWPKRFFVNGIPIRVFKNYEKIGAKYPKAPMYVHASLWNGTQWLGPTDWNRGPFYANFRGFTIDGCSSQNWNKTNCNSPKYIWNSPKFHKLDRGHQMLHDNFRKGSMTYDYCKSNSNNFPECRMDS
ncbi:hypothetical protein C2S53_004782 [Perilla frutescens var. hirtella]|uniref:GH16 domain-containing protein n=1 Tax=Perilla frutescens var. hirtella TaxID=608512 RepID=A0AAD4PCD2_PERFH|nr:hypothetical protein C2S53_004782 [Perilla frutescens var. hirtella]